jgi:nucleoside-diphosphate-sugar epimerase
MSALRHVVFGTGTIGAALIDQLVERELPVRAVNRTGRAAVPAGVEVVGGDASDPAFTTDVAQGAAAVYQVVNPGYHQWPQKFPPLQRAIVAAAQSSGARLVSFENVYMYGDTGGRPITEDLPYAATTRKGRVRAAMAQELAELQRKGAVQLATARASDYFGPWATSQSPLGDRVIGAALAGKPAQVIGDPDQPHSYTFTRDAAKVLATLGTDPRAIGEVWHVPNAPARPTRELIAMIAAELQREIKVRAAPRLLLRLIGVVDPQVRELPEMLYEFTQPFIVDGAKFERTFGFGATSFTESIPATVTWWRGHMDEPSSTHADGR